jgi:hypothetical protein
MIRPAFTWLLLAVCVGGCVDRDRLNTDCEWSHDKTTSLNLENASDQRHLNHDALIAEEIAIRYADVRRGHRSGHFESLEAYSRTRDACLARLSKVIASYHGVTPVQVGNAVGNRDRRVDLAVTLAFVALYTLVAGRIVGWLFTRFPPDERWPALLAGLVLSVIASTAAVMLGELGSSIVDMIRVHNTHLSYRALRNPWAQHRPDLWVGALLVFWLIACAVLVRSRPSYRAPRSAA